MTDRKDKSQIENATAVNPGYAASQIAKALTTSEEHHDPATRERAQQRIAKWETVLQNILTGTVNYGTRTPIRATPVWATPEVVTGGFVTGELLAAGPLQEHEKKLLEILRAPVDAKARQTLNAYFLTDAGLADLSEKLRSSCYDTGVPEEAALLVVAWLVDEGHSESARALIDELSPYFSHFRFYPIPTAEPRRFGSRVHLQDVETTIRDLRQIRQNHRILAQKEAIEVWVPYYDLIIKLFLETVVNGWPCQHFPEDWQERARILVGQYADLRSRHSLCGKPERRRKHFSELREFLRRCSIDSTSLSGRDVGKIRLILNQYVEKRGTPDSTRCVESRGRQVAAVSGPTFHEISKVVVPRLERHSKNDGLDDVSHLKSPVSREEAAISRVPQDTPIPLCIQQKVERCLNEAIDVLIERDLVTSGETLARVLPQMISGLRAAGISDPKLRQLYGAIYRAFRRRRSLLLLNLEKQVQIEELPWVAAIENFRNDNLSSRELAGQTLEEITMLTVSSFPHAILPNKLLQELRALVKGAGLKLPLIDELAADIFMGEFSDTFVESAKIAGRLLAGTLYASYFGIDYDVVQSIPKREKSKPSSIWFWSQTPFRPDDKFAQLCAERAGVNLGTWDPATNGMIIEQQQILTTQNLATLFSGLHLTEALQNQLDGMARRCFIWVCDRQQMKIDNWHGRLTMLKNTAYGWRQMIFFLSLLPKESVLDFLGWAEGYFATQSERFRERFHPALRGLVFVAQHGSIDADSSTGLGLRRFLGWSNTMHWLLADESPR